MTTPAHPSYSLEQAEDDIADLRGQLAVIGEHLMVAGQVIIGGAGGATVIYPPSGDTTGATDPDVVQTLLNAGYSVHLTDGHYYANALVAYPPSQEIRGTGWGYSGNGTNWEVTAAIDAAFASAGWQTNANNGGAPDPVSISNMKISCGSNATHGIVSQNWRSTFRDLFIESPVLDGLRLDATGKNGTTEITGSAVENYIERCVFQSCGQAGFHVHEGSTARFTDGFLLNCIVASPASDAVSIPHAAGWLISGNHLYGLPLNGFKLSALFQTRVIGNYIENWGSSATAAFYNAISASANADNGPPSIIAENVANLTTAPGNAGSTIQGIGWATTAGATSNPVIENNALRCAPAAGAAAYNAIQLSNGSAASTTNVLTNGSNAALGNWTNQLLLVANGGVMNHYAGV